MWEAFADRVERRASRSAEQPVRRDPPGDGRAHRRGRADGTERARGRRRAVEHPAPRSDRGAGPARARAVRSGGQAPLSRALPRRADGDQEEPFPDNWIYLHDPKTRAGRVQNFGAWSPTWCAERRASGSSTSASRATTSGRCRPATPSRWRPRELAANRAARREPRLRRRQGPRSARLSDVRLVLSRRGPRSAAISQFENIATFGRNGLHRYNNQDHSMWTAILATLNMIDDVDTTSGRSTQGGLPGGGRRGRGDAGPRRVAPGSSRGRAPRGR